MSLISCPRRSQSTAGGEGSSRPASALRVSATSASHRVPPVLPALPRLGLDPCHGLTVQGDGRALDQAGRQGLPLTHRPLVCLAEQLSGVPGSLEPCIVQLEVPRVAACLFINHRRPECRPQSCGAPVESHGNAQPVGPEPVAGQTRVLSATPWGTWE